MRLTPAERAALAASLQQFQLGEGSDGRNLLSRGAQYATAQGDPHFLPALQLFIAEEQRHSAWLGRYLDLQGIPRLREHWIDQAFRRVRRLAGLRLALTVLVTAEIIAVPYYRALREATSSLLLRTLCDRILADEADHLRYQASNLARLREDLPLVLQRLHPLFHRSLLEGTLVLVWLSHRGVFRQGNYSFSRFAREARREFRQLWASTTTGSANAAQGVGLPGREPARPRMVQ